MTALIACGFEWVWTTTIMASLLTLMILLAKVILKDRIKPRTAYLFWVLLVIRLVIPWSSESSLNMFNLVHLESAADTSILQFVRDLPSTVENEIATNSNKPSDVNIPLAVPDRGGSMWLQVLILGWAIGTIIMIILIVIKNAQFALKLKRQPRIVESDITLLFERCKKLLKLNRKVILLETSLVSTPTLFGVLRPKLLLPQEVVHILTQDQLKFVFMHELSHIKRNDIFANWVMSVALALHWFNPVLWLAYHKMREDQEIACDSQVMTYIEPNESKDYALTIIKLLENFSLSTRFIQAAGIANNKKKLKRRLLMITKHKKNSYKLSVLGSAVLLFLGGCSLTMPQTSEKNSMSLEEKTSMPAKEFEKAPLESANKIISNYFEAIVKTKDNDETALIKYKILKTSPSDNSDFKISVKLTFAEDYNYPPVDYHVVRSGDSYQVKKQFCVYDADPKSKNRGSVRCTSDFVDSGGAVSIRTNILSYSENEIGQTYGSVERITPDEIQSDLIHVGSVNGINAYMLKKDYEPGRDVPLYDVDGKTIIGSYHIATKNKNYPQNENGQTYGAAPDATSSESEPDLISATGVDRTQGYVLKKDLEGELPKSPEEAIAIQNSRPKGGYDIPLYDVDGKTVIGVFHISN